MGLLDGLMNDPGTMGLLGGGAAMLNASGPSLMPHSLGQVIGQGLQGATTGYRDQYKQNQLEQMNQLELLSKKIGLQQAMAKMKLMGQLTGDAGQSDSQLLPSQPAITAPSASSMPLGSGMNGMAPAQPEDGQQAIQPTRTAGNPNVRAMMGLALMDGKIGDAYGMQKDMITGFGRDAGKYYTMPDGSQQYLMDPTKGVGIGPDGKTMIDPNFAGITGQIAGATTAAQEAAKAPYTSQTITGPKGRPMMMSGDQIFQMLHPNSQTAQQPSTSPTQPSGSQGDYTDLSSLPPAQQQFLAKLNPQAYAATANRFAAQQSQAAPQQAQRQAMPYSASSGFGGGIPIQSPAEAKDALDQLALRNAPELASANKIAEGNASNFNTYKDTLNKNVDSGYAQYLRNQQVRQLMTEYQTGLSSPDARTAFASTLKNAFPGNSAAKAFAEKINGGNVGSGQELANLLSSAGLTNVIRTLDGNGRVNKAEYEALQSHAETNRSDPDALLGIMGFQDNVYKQQLAEQQSLSKKEKGGTLNPATWQSDYAQMRHDNQTPATLPPTPGQSVPAKTGGKVATLSDIAVTAKKMGISTAEATKQLKAAGYSIGGN